MKRAYFVTGTDTEVGKTLCTAAWLRVARLQGLRTVGMKPIASGCVATPAGLRNEDALAHLAESSAPQPDYAAINPHAFAPAIAPHIAAAEAGVRIDPERLCRQWQALTADRDFALMEGAGGWLVPITDSETLGDFAARLKLPVIVVVANRLGCLNHTLLTLESIRARNLPCPGIILNHLTPDSDIAQRTNAQILARHTRILLEIHPGQTHIPATEITRFLDTVTHK